MEMDAMRETIGHAPIDLDRRDQLLASAMREAGKVGIARVVIRTKEQLVAIRPVGDVLAMATMNFADEVVDPDSFDEAPGDDVDATKRELEMASQLVNSLTAEFKPEKYHDEYREAVLDMIEKKSEGQEIVLQPAEEPEKVPDLMAALEASLAAAKEDGGDGAAAKPRRRQRASASNGADGAKNRSSSGRGSRSKSKS